MSLSVIVFLLSLWMDEKGRAVYRVLGHAGDFVRYLVHFFVLHFHIFFFFFQLALSHEILPQEFWWIISV